MVRETQKSRPATRAASAVGRASGLSYKNSKNEDTPQPSDDKSSDRDDIYSKLLNLGAPEMSEQDFTQLCRGPLADVLSFIAEHVKGRSETAAARAAIQRVRETGKGKDVASTAGNGQTSYLKAKSANLRAVGARSDYEATQAAFSERSKSMADLENVAHRLRTDLGERCMTSFLMKVMKGKETVRSARLAETGRILEELSKENPFISLSGKADARSNDLPPELPPPRSCPIHAEHTRDVLASLQAHHIQLAHVFKPSADVVASSGANEARLLKAVASAMKLPEDNEQVLAAFESCRRLAKERAGKVFRYQSPLDPESAGTVHEMDLSDRLDRIARKEDNVQQVADSAAALECSCAQALQSISAFRETALPELCESLQDEVAATQGYVDALRLSILNRSKASMAKHDANNVDSAFLQDGKAWHRMLEDVQKAIDRTHEREEFLRNAALPGSTNEAGKHDELISAHMQRQAKADERVAKLLARKLEKARAGDVLARDVEQLMAEVKIVGSLGSSRERSDRS